MKFILLLVVVFFIATAKSKKWRALAMSGGGDRGAYEASVFIELTNLLPLKEVSYDVITGVSAGSMNAWGLGLFKPEDIYGATEFVFGIWNSISTKQVFKMWPGGILEGLFKKSGILDTQPLVDFVNAQAENRTIGKKVTFALWDANNAEYVTYDYNETDTLPSDYIMSAVGSSSIPFAFPHLVRGDKVLMDGGSLWNVDVPSAVRRCREVVDNDEDIIIDLLICFGSSLPTKIPEEEFKKYNSLDHYERAKSIKSFYDSLNKIESAQFLYPDVDFRYIIMPSESLSIGNPIPLEFNQKQINWSFEVGKKDARNAVKLGPKEYLEILKKYRDNLINGIHSPIEELIQNKLGQTNNSW